MLMTLVERLELNMHHPSISTCSRRYELTIACHALNDLTKQTVIFPSLLRVMLPAYLQHFHFKAGERRSDSQSRHVP